MLSWCQVCRFKIAKYNCIFCGKAVCEEDYDKPSGLCIICKQGGRIKGKNGMQKRDKLKKM